MEQSLVVGDASLSLGGILTEKKNQTPINDVAW